MTPIFNINDKVKVHPSRVSIYDLKSDIGEIIDIRDSHFYGNPYLISFEDGKTKWIAEKNILARVYQFFYSI